MSAFWIGADLDQNYRVGIGQFLIWVVRIYQIVISPMIGPHCRFQPTCSNYTIEAIESYGLIKGLILGIRRISRCHPWHPGGLDPVPQKKI